MQFDLERLAKVLMVCRGSEVSLDLRPGVSICMYTKLHVVQELTWYENKGDQAMGQEIPCSCHGPYIWEVGLHNTSS